MKLLSRVRALIRRRSHGILTPVAIEATLPLLNAEEVKRWWQDGGDETFRYSYDLNESSLVLDLGGYKGDWSSEIFARYCCSIHVFEPITEFAASIRERFQRNNQIHVHDFGLGGASAISEMAKKGDESSLLVLGENSTQVKIVDIVDWVRSNNIDMIDLMKINIEGGEYALLERMIESNLTSICRDIQVQFHRVGEDFERRAKWIQDALGSTHCPTYQYSFVWENWHRRD